MSETADHLSEAAAHDRHPVPTQPNVTNASVPPTSTTGCCGKTNTNHYSQEPDILTRLTAGDDCEQTCCEKEDGPHCNDVCVKAYATLECHTTSHADPEHEQPTDGHCTSHLQSAMKRYEQLLMDAHCLCKSVLSYSMIHCCGSDAGRGSSSETSSFRFSVNEARPTDDAEQVGHLEHVLLNVQGMTCTGCENKLIRALESTPGVSNIKTSFLNSRADFDLDEAVTKSEDLVRRVHTMTGFQVARLQSTHQSIDVVMEKSKARELMLMGIPGLMDVTIVDKKTVSLTYNPEVISARRLLDMACGGPDSLAPPQPSTALLDSKKLLRTMAWKTLVSTVLTIPVVVLAWAPTGVAEKITSIISLILATFVQGIAVTEFYKNAFRAFWHDRSVELDTLVVISITAAYIYSVVAFGFLMVDRPLDTKEFFETSTLLISLVLLGRLIATYARTRAVKAVSMRSLQATTAMLIVDKEDHHEIDARLLEYGDHFLVQPHSRIPTDGQVVDGQSEVDESMLTGESMPVPKSAGDDLIAGTINGDGTLKARPTRLPGKNTVTEIAELVEQANSAKPKIQDLADRVASWFIPVVVVLATVTFAVQIAVSIRLRGQSSGAAAGTAISYAIAVLAVSCPCALGLAVPMVLVVTGGVAARSGVIIKSSEATERSWQITDVVFDKTGTLTMPDLEVTDEHILCSDSDHARALALTLTKGNKHPVSVSIARHLSGTVKSEIIAQGIKVVPGCGVEAKVDGVVVKAGNPSWLSFTNRDIVRALAASGKTVLCITQAGNLIAVYGLKTTMRPEAADVVEVLQRRNIDVHLISGDSSLAVQTCAETLGIPLANVRSRCTPAEKQTYVLGQVKRRKVLFVGDGTNDAIALSSSFVGVQIGTASDVVSSTASVSLLGSLNGIIYLLDLSKAAYRRVVFNFVWAAVYNVFAILLAAGAFVRVRIEPRWAGLGEIVSVVPVVVVAVTMRRWGREV
ncbi:putative copper-translocating P-type ATPase [Elsinoe ampelina]|uniref:Putative copper-translocating P-type ATPase n=1 Tax=Elsinoe ampelina TaxID=302913 RepID=A0A6A6GFM1_9PEZI|nr:putative copper-translocating P-type ATPase [Elsinoe ampelina]